MKKLAVLGLSGLLVMVILVGCGRDIVTTPISNVETVLSGQVIQAGQAVPNAEVLAAWSIERDTLLVCDDQGRFHFDCHSDPVVVTAAVLGAWGMTEVSDAKLPIVIQLQPVVPADPSAHPLGTASEYWFGVYDTDSHGDVRFRYRFNFSRYYCSSWLPGWPFGDPNPNHWDGWSLTDFPYPWKGKKLLVPERSYQWWHQRVYGFSISYALFLISTS